MIHVVRLKKIDKTLIPCRLFDAIASLELKGVISDSEHVQLKDLVVRANSHTLAVLSAAISVYEAELSNNSDMAVECASRELHDTFCIILSTSFMM